jgi:uncharacterized UBP type Zn finger protein
MCEIHLCATVLVYLKISHRKRDGASVVREKNKQQLFLCLVSSIFHGIRAKMGKNISQLERDIGSDFPANEHYFGLVNVSAKSLKIHFINSPSIDFLQFGNTCYSNSVLQALYFCKPFRDKVLEYKMKNKRNKETLLTCLADL